MKQLFLLERFLAYESLLVSTDMLCSEKRSQHLSLVDMQGSAHLNSHAQLFHNYATRENEEHPATLPVLRASHKAQKNT
jgi:hypothetical protein